MSVYKINPDKTETSDSCTCIYTIYGTHTYLDSKGYPRLDSSDDSSYDAHAKSIAVGERIKYFAKRGRHGKLYNPIGLYSEGTSRKQARHAGRPEWEFKEVTKSVFDKYINFLKTKNPAWLNNAERE